ncbi:ABC transporter permease [Acinetobacter apis]|uniref:Sulfonate transport system permease protein n=1 Tax=Acinetobacter apis TaxID=1229165 RepID=A0A217EEI9_9GAMM|nr:ABC transporter permease [Acinetobacter apis]SNQ28883.1 sulfonate transport system permease protein [Acinetobacter apis]
MWSNSVFKPEGKVNTSSTYTFRSQTNSWKTKLSTGIKGLILPLLLLSLAEMTVRQGWIAPYLLPAPSSLWQTFLELLHADLFSHIYISSVRVGIGFFIGSGLGLIVAIAVGLNKHIEDYLDPTLSAIKSIPSLAWIPLLLLWLGIDESSKLTLIIIGAFFPTYTNTVAAIQHVDPKLIELGVAYNLNRFQRIVQIILPAALSGILTGVRNSLSLSWMFMVAAELIAATQGIGYLLSDGRETARPDIVIVAILLLALLGKMTDLGMKKLEQHLLRWR